MDANFSAFAPSEGAILDQVSLQAIADVPSAVLGMYLDARAPKESNLFFMVWISRVIWQLVDLLN